MFNAVWFYAGFVYLVSWLQTADGIPPAQTLEINTLSMTIMLAVVVAGGALSDRFGRKPLLLIPVIFGFLAALPLFWLMNHPSMLLAQLGQLGLVLIVGLYGGAQPAVLVEAAPSGALHGGGVGLQYLFWSHRRLDAARGRLAGRTHRRRDAPAFLIMAAAAVAFFTILRFPETYRAPFADGASPAARV